MITNKKPFKKLIETISEKKSEKITLYHIQKSTYIVDFFLILTANNYIHVKSIAESIKSLYKSQNEEIVITGESKSEWILIDTGEIVIHVTTQSIREKYDLDNFYKQDSIVYHY